MEDTEILVGCGLTEIESKVYIELIRLGPSTAYRIAKEAGVHKANCYDALKSLSDKGLVSSVIQQGHTIYQSTNPENLLQLLRRKEEQVSMILPKLRLMEGMVSEKSEVSIHKGVPMFMNLLYGVLEYKKPILVFGIPKIAPETLRLYIGDFHKERVRRKIRMDQIYNYDATERIQYLRTLPFTGAKALPESVVSTTSTLICGSEVHISIWLENTVKVIRIIDKDIADSYRSYFTFLWKIAK